MAIVRQPGPQSASSGSLLAPGAAARRGVSPRPHMDVVKAHAYGNDFLLVPADQASGRNAAALARAACNRHLGLGADGLILYVETAGGAAMRLLNADGSPAEVSGNGVRCLAAWLVARSVRRGGQGTDTAAVRTIHIDTEAGEKRLVLLAREGRRLVFQAAMGAPENLRVAELDASGERVQAVILRVGNPQCVVLGEVTDARLERLGPALATHAAFPEGTNVELAAVEAPDTVRILIWERGVGPTASSGTGACAAAVAAAAYGGASRDVRVVAPGGTQRVEWRDDGLYLTGWAEIVFEGRWLGVPDMERS